MVRKNGLGKGLDSLIPSTGHKKAAPAKPEVKKEVVVEKVIKKEEVMVKITEVEPNREQPRKNFNEDALLELADSIKQFGIIQPLVVQKQDDYYEIIAGERRWRAAKLAGLKEVPVIIKNYTEQERVEIALIENIQREDLNPIEEAMAFKRLLTEFDLKQDELPIPCVFSNWMSGCSRWWWMKKFPPAMREPFWPWGTRSSSTIWQTRSLMKNSASGRLRG